MVLLHKHLINNIPILQVSSYKYLSVILDNRFSWEDHLENLANLYKLNSFKLQKNNIFANFYCVLLQYALLLCWQSSLSNFIKRMSNTTYTNLAYFNELFFLNKDTQQSRKNFRRQLLTTPSKLLQVMTKFVTSVHLPYQPWSPEQTVSYDLNSMAMPIFT